MTTAYIGMGSNLGDRAESLRAAVERLRAEPGIDVMRTSPFYETAPIGPVKQGQFLNAVLEVQTAHSPYALLHRLRRIENESGRIRRERWGPRTLDLDLLAHGQAVIATPELTLPHPEATHRAFVLAPWADLAPDFFLRGQTVREWLAACDQTGVRKFDCAS
ncbi:MAG: 2-amino-4-hydroxy-6-hydroxymethyldihydropteridine diphosphokinase [Puniceicoccales bacterium]